ncbi:MAG: hypothetical protein ACR2QH_14235, partial [Geminicoccaceae bacterium]
MKRALKWGLIGSAILLFGGAGLFVYDEPAAGMYVCPGCYGFEAVGSRLYADRAMDADAILTFDADLGEGLARVESFFGQTRSDPYVFVCSSEACNARMDYRGSKAKAFGSSFILVFAQGRSAEFLAHELSHIELHHRIGLRRGFSGAIPAWFDEGLATVISRDSRFVGVGPGGEPTCIAEPDGPLPTHFREWGKVAGKKDRPVYAMAACAVIRWMKENGGRQGVLDTIDRVAQGEVIVNPPPSKHPPPCHTTHTSPLHKNTHHPFD